MLTLCFQYLVFIPLENYLNYKYNSKILFDFYLTIKKITLKSIKMNSHLQYYLKKILPF